MFWFARIIAPQAMNDLLADAVFLPNSRNDGIPTRSAAGDELAWVGLASFPINGTQGYDCHERHASVLGNLRSIRTFTWCRLSATSDRPPPRFAHSPRMPGGGVTCGQMLRSAPRCYHECPECAAGCGQHLAPHRPTQRRHVIGRDDRAAI
jgi:hypothetical protein